MEDIVEEKKCIDCKRCKEQADSDPCFLCASLDKKPYFVSMFEKEKLIKSEDEYYG